MWAGRVRGGVYQGLRACLRCKSRTQICMDKSSEITELISTKTQDSS